MPRHHRTAAVLLLSSLVASAVSAQPMGRGSETAPPPPAYHFDHPPQTTMVAGSQVYVVDDRRVSDDVFRYGVFWYVYRGHSWYRGRSWNGPYAGIEPRDVPRAIITVPPGRWKHQVTTPPGLANRRNAPAWVAEKERRIHGGR
jgi:hypothetical protein